jgi:hypothetical protein
MGSKSGQVQETSQQKALATHAMQQLQDYKARWAPVQAKLAQTIEAQGEKDSAARRLAEGKASTDVAMNFDKANSALEKSMANSGVAPGSSRANLATAGLGTDQATSGGLSHLMSEQQIDDAYTQGLGALMSLGRGERATVGNSLTSMAKASAEQAGADAQAALMNRQGNAQIIGQVAGFGIQQGMGKLGSGQIQAAFSQTALGGSGFGSGLAYGNQDLGVNL